MKNEWKFTYQTPYQSEVNGSIFGATAHVSVETDQKIFGRPVSDTICYLPHWRDDKENDKYIAIGKLIAAAPDLLKALEELVTQVQRDCSIGSEPKYFDMLQRVQEAHTAIKKAKQ